MFIRRQDVIDRFASNFRDDVEGRLFFHPRPDLTPVPVSWEEYEALMATFERVQIRNQIVTWIVTLGAAGYGTWKVLTEDAYLTFFLAMGAAFVFSAMIHLRDGLHLLLPYIEQRADIDNQRKDNLG